MKETKDKGITLISLIITIIILLILAGITISILGGENGLLTRARQTKQAQTEAEMKEQLTIALQDLQAENLGNATLDDVTQEWINEKIKNYECTIQEDGLIDSKKVIMQKNGIICKFLVDENLQIITIEGNGAELEYKIVSKSINKATILITITDKENGIDQVEFSDGNIIYCNGKEQVSKDYVVDYGIEYKIKIISKNGIKKEEKILIEEKWKDGYYEINNETLSFSNIVIVGQSEECKTVKQAFDYLCDNGYKENAAIVLTEGSYDTGDLHTGTSYTINPKYNGMSVSIIADSPGKTFMTSGEIAMAQNGSNYSIKLKFYRIIFTLPVYSDVSTNGFHLNDDIQTNEYYNCVFIPPVGGYNGIINNASINMYNCLFMGGGNSYYNNYPLTGLAQNCASTTTAIAPSNGTKTTCLTNVTVDANYNITSSGWENTGTGENPDGTKAHIGVYGGKYAW